LEPVRKGDQTKGGKRLGVGVSNLGGEMVEKEYSAYKKRPFDRT